MVQRLYANYRWIFAIYMALTASQKLLLVESIFPFLESEVFQILVMAWL